MVAGVRRDVIVFLEGEGFGIAAYLLSGYVGGYKTYTYEAEITFVTSRGGSIDWNTVVSTYLTYHLVLTFGSNNQVNELRDNVPSFL